MYEAPEIARTEGGFIDDDRDIAIFATRSHCYFLIERLLRKFLRNIFRVLKPRVT